MRACSSSDLENTDLTPLANRIYSPPPPRRMPTWYSDDTEDEPQQYGNIGKSPHAKQGKQEQSEKRDRNVGEKQHSIDNVSGNQLRNYELLSCIQSEAEVLNVSKRRPRSHQMHHALMRSLSFRTATQVSGS